MLTGLEFWHLVAHIIPVYFVVVCGYGSVRLKIFLPVHYPGVNRFVSVIGIPFYAFHLLAFNDPYQISLRLVGADALQKVVALTAGLLWWRFYKSGKIDHTINFFMLASLPNTVLIGDALLDPLYGDGVHGKVVTIIFMQAIIWYNLTITLYEMRGVLLSLKAEESGNFVEKELGAEKLGASSRNSALAIVVDKNDDKLNASKVNGTAFKQEVNLARLSSALITRTTSAPPCVSAISKVTPTIYGSAGFGEKNSLLSNDWSRPSGSQRSHRSRTARVKNGSSMTSIDLDDEEAKEFGNHMHGENTAEEESQPEGTIVDPNPADQAESKMKKRQEMVFAGKVTVKALQRLRYAPLMHGSILGFIYSLIAYKYGWTMPYSVQTSLELLSNTALGMAMFILGMTWAISGELVSCGWKKLVFGMFARFIIGPFIVIVTALVFGLKGDNYRFAVLQAVIPQGVISFVLAKEYDLDEEEFATAVIFQLLVFIPIVVVYYFALDSI